MTESDKFMQARVPSHVRREVKKTAADLGISMQEAITAGMTDWLQKHNAEEDHDAHPQEVERQHEEQRWIDVLLACMRSDDPHMAGHWHSVRCLLREFANEAKTRSKGVRARGEKEGRG